jgi:hypothetical protein
MIEKLIENWLINVHELGYQIPFCEVLLTEKLFSLARLQTRQISESFGSLSNSTFRTHMIGSLEKSSPTF